MMKVSGINKAPKSQPPNPPRCMRAYPGEGYRLLRPGERVQESDQRWDGKAWVPVRSYDFTHSSELAPRRRIVLFVPEESPQSVVNVYGLDYTVPEPVARQIANLKRQVLVLAEENTKMRERHLKYKNMLLAFSYGNGQQ